MCPPSIRPCASVFQYQGGPLNLLRYHMKTIWLNLIAAAAGIFVWAAVSTTTSRTEAWDSPLYFTAGIPFLCVVSGLLAFIEPKRLRRWAVIPLASQALWMLLTQGFGNMAPMAVLVFAVLAIPLLAGAWIGAFFGKRSRL